MHPRPSTSCRRIARRSLRATLALFRGCVPSKERRFGALDLLPKEELEEAKTKLTEASKQVKFFRLWSSNLYSQPAKGWARPKVMIMAQEGMLHRRRFHNHFIQISRSAPLGLVNVSKEAK